MVRDGTFRADLYYRLHVASLIVPPLRQRRQDIAPLARHALEDLARIYREPQKTIASSAMNLLHQYDWPGNVRELINALEHALVFAAGSQITCDDLPATLRGAPAIERFADDCIMTLDAAQRGLIARALKAADGNQSRAAEMLAIERHRLHRIIRRYHLEHLTKPKSR
jgi:DNA-binding NtrC family response regulator